VGDSPNPADFLAVVLGTHADEAGVNDRINDGRSVRGLLVVVFTVAPFVDVEVA